MQHHRHTWWFTYIYICIYVYCNINRPLDHTCSVWMRRCLWVCVCVNVYICVCAFVHCIPQSSCNKKAYVIAKLGEYMKVNFVTGDRSATFWWSHLHAHSVRVWATYACAVLVNGTCWVQHSVCHNNKHVYYIVVTKCEDYILSGLMRKRTFTHSCFVFHYHQNKGTRSCCTRFRPLVRQLCFVCGCVC